MSSVKSAAPKARHLVRVPADAIAATSAKPLAVSRIGRRSIVPFGSPFSRSTCATSQSAVRSSCALSTFGSTMPSIFGPTTARISPYPKSVESGLTRTYPMQERGLAIAVAINCRVAIFSATGQASSRSRITASAWRVRAFSLRRAWFPGANSNDLSGLMPMSLFDTDEAVMLIFSKDQIRKTPGEQNTSRSDSCFRTNR